MADTELAVIGGSGFYSWMEGAREVRPHTPYGPPSAPVSVGEIGGRRVAFLPRHGRDHEWPPHRVPYRANLWALRELGVRRVIGPCAVGSLRPDLHPGDVLIPDQLVDRTSGRADTFLDGPAVDHTSFADPYCPELAGVLAGAAEVAGCRVARGGTVVVIQGPRFSTRAESRWFRAAGWDVVGMTQYPEAYLARELGLCYAAMALVTDYDTGVEDAPGGPGAGPSGAAPPGPATQRRGAGAPVTMEQVMEVLAANAGTTRRILAGAVPAVPAEAGCGCAGGGSLHLLR